MNALTICDMTQPDEAGGRFAKQKMKGAQIKERGARQKDEESDHCDEKSRWRADHAGRRGGT